MKISLRPNRITKLVSNGGQISLENGLFFNSNLVFTHFLKHSVHFFHLINEEKILSLRIWGGVGWKTISLLVFIFSHLSLSLIDHFNVLHPPSLGWLLKSPHPQSNLKWDVWWKLKKLWMSLKLIDFINKFKIFIKMHKFFLNVFLPNLLHLINSCRYAFKKVVLVSTVFWNLANSNMT